ncbi:MAG TPA: IclR family transcriptional regulator [Niallia sp.]|nr:IclR family transcriptional regulator [Niallia sp.]
MEKQPYGTVLIKAAKIMDVLSEHKELSLQKIALLTGLTSSTTLKILDTLILIGYVKKDEKKKEFSLGSKLIRYANQQLEDNALVQSAKPFLVDLQNRIDETIHLGILFDNNSVMYVDKLEPKNQVIYMTSKVGITRPLYSSAMGKAILSELEEQRLLDYLDNTNLKAYTVNTITNKFKLMEEIELVKKTEIAFDDEEMEADCFCVGTSLVRNGKIRGAFSVSMPKYRLNQEKKEFIMEQVKQTKKKIEEKL